MKMEENVFLKCSTERYHIELTKHFCINI